MNEIIHEHATQKKRRAPTSFRLPDDRNINKEHSVTYLSLPASTYAA